MTNNQIKVFFQGIDHSYAIEDKIRDKISKLQNFCNQIVSCNVTVSKSYRNSASNSHKKEPFHVMIDLGVPGGHLVVSRNKHDMLGMQGGIYTVIRYAFDNMKRQLKGYCDRHF